ncbi:putative purine nucleoside [Lyophyllum shimeji]|uniref:Purine nucleoside n=1 Tax=Lyophyllum shimeji TaxID=47721 RepID=A0A9P3PX33_LYOSH|nr:putative purine nucleoside [Lyophyllum shimeji]
MLWPYNLVPQDTSSRYPEQQRIADARTMRLFLLANLLWLAALAASSVVLQPDGSATNADQTGISKIKPQVFIISMFADEGEVWYNIPEFDLLARNVTVPGLSPLFPDVHCTRNGSICQLTTGEAEINAATTITSLIFSPFFDLTKTYFLIAGIAGVNPKLATTGSVTFARYAVQVALQYEFDARDKPADFPTGYVPQGSFAPDQFPAELYGTEVFEVNDALKKLAVGFAKKAKLNDTLAAQVYRTNYGKLAGFEPGTSAPSVVECDTATADNFWSGTLLSEAFENTTALFTNGTGVYCTTQQEDNATLESLMRGHMSKLVDFSRIIIMRTASDFDREFPGQSAADNLFGDPGGFIPSILNLHLAGVKVIEGIINGWDRTFARGVKPTNYIGDILGSIGGTPGFGPGNVFEKQVAKSFRSVRTGVRSRRRRSI